jgi:hypothetical protein
MYNQESEPESYQESEPESFFTAFTQFDRYEEWAPSVQGSGHWLMINEGGVSSQFILYDKPDLVHLAHFGTIETDEPFQQFS